MQTRWRNLLLVLALLALVFLGYVLFFAQPFAPLPASQAIDSFEKAEAEINAILIATPGFEPKSASFKTIDPVPLAKAKEQIQLVKARVGVSAFSQKSAALALADAWIARIELALSWKRMQEYADSAQFSQSDSLETICQQKEFLLELKARVLAASGALENAQETHASFSTGAATLASQNGFVQPISGFSEPELDKTLEKINQLLGSCP